MSAAAKARCHRGSVPTQQTWRRSARQLSLLFPHLQVTCLVHPPVTGKVTVDATAASAIAVYVEALELPSDVRTSSVSVRLLP